jgi:hypothetical protein
MNDEIRVVRKRCIDITRVFFTGMDGNRFVLPFGISDDPFEIHNIPGTAHTEPVTVAFTSVTTKDDTPEVLAEGCLAQCGYTFQTTFPEISTAPCAAADHLSDACAHTGYNVII